MKHIAFHKDHREGVLDYQAQRVLILGLIYAYDPYLGTTWVFTEEISAFPRNHSTEIYETLHD
jgi:hypothetical protein